LEKTIFSISFSGWFSTVLLHVSSICFANVWLWSRSDWNSSHNVSVSLFSRSRLPLFVVLKLHGRLSQSMT
jgi:hypothetical protein